MKLKREPGLRWQRRRIKEREIFRGAKQNNDGFEMYRSLEHSANVQGHKFSYSDRNAFLISIDTHEGEAGGGMSSSK